MAYPKLNSGPENGSVSRKERVAVSRCPSDDVEGAELAAKAFRYAVSTLAVAASLALGLLSGCKKPQVQNREQGEYRVVSYDAAKQQWTILRDGTLDGTYMEKRFFVVCQSYRLGEQPPVLGPGACHLLVGRSIIPHLAPDRAHRKEFVDVFEMPNGVLSVTEGDGSDQVTQQFKILRYEVVKKQSGHFDGSGIADENRRSGRMSICPLLLAVITVIRFHVLSGADAIASALLPHACELPL